MTTTSNSGRQADYLHQRLWPQPSWRGKFAELKPHLAENCDRFEAEALRLLATAGQSTA